MKHIVFPSVSNEMYAIMFIIDTTHVLCSMYYVMLCALMKRCGLSENKYHTLNS